MSCPSCKRFAKVLSKDTKRGIALKFCKGCNLVYANQYYSVLGVFDEVDERVASIMVNSPAWNKLVEGVELPHGALCVDWRYKNEESVCDDE